MGPTWWGLRVLMRGARSGHDGQGGRVSTRGIQHVMPVTPVCKVMIHVSEQVVSGEVPLVGPGVNADDEDDDDGGWRWH